MARAMQVPAASSAWRLMALLALAARSASAHTQTISTDVTYLRLGPNAVCGNAVPGHTLLCFDPAVAVPLGSGAQLRVTTANVTLTSGTTTVTLTAAGTVLINGAAAGPAGTMTVAGTLVNRVDGIWNVQRETLLSPVGAVQDVCVVGTGVCGLRLVLSPDDPSIGVVAGGKVIIDDNISLPMVLGALSSDTIHVVSRWSIFSAQQHSQLVLPVDIPANGEITLTLREFTGNSSCGNAYYRQEVRTVLAQTACFVLTNSTRTALGLGSGIAAVRLAACPPLGTVQLNGTAFTTAGCVLPYASTFNVTLGACVGTDYMFECMSAL